MTINKSIEESTIQPKGLYVLFFTELWERYGFYTVQTLLVLFLTNAFLFSDQKAYGLFGAFGSLIYATPVIGGYLADRYLGFRHSIFLGGILFVVGYIGLALFAKTHWFYVSLAFLICGNGFFKSSVSSLLGQLYKKNDIRRETGFTLFYMGINIGSFSASFFGALMAAKYGWNYAFGMAALGMSVGILTLTYGQKYLQNQGLAPAQPRQSRRYCGLKINYLIYLGTFVTVILFGLMLQTAVIINWLILSFGIVIACYLLVLIVKLPKPQALRMTTLLILLFFSVAFWALYYQTFTSITLFIERVVNRQLFDILIPTAMFQSINPIVIILFSPLFGWLWLTLAKRKLNPSMPMKFALGLLFMGIGFLVITLAVALTPEGVKVPWIWLILIFTFQTCGELCLSPIGLSMITVLAPPQWVGMLMGVWFLSLGGATAIAGKIAAFTAIPQTLTNPVAIAQVYSHAFRSFGLASLACALILILLTPWLKQLMSTAEKIV